MRKVDVNVASVTGGAVVLLRDNHVGKMCVWLSRSVVMDGRVERDGFVRRDLRDVVGLRDVVLRDIRTNKK